MRVLHQFYLDHVLNAWNWSQMVVGSLPTPSISRSYIICPHLELLINNPTQLFFLMWSGGQFVNEIFNGLHYFPPNDIIYMYKESDYIVEFLNFLVQHWCYRVLKREVGRLVLMMSGWSGHIQRVYTHPLGCWSCFPLRGISWLYTGLIGLIEWNIYNNNLGCTRLT